MALGLVFTTQILDIANMVVSGAQMRSYAYHSGQTTKNVWADVGLTVPLPNPVLGNANGSFVFYFDPTQSYTWEFRSADGGAILAQYDVVNGVVSLVSGGSGGVGLILAGTPTTNPLTLQLGNPDILGFNLGALGLIPGSGTGSPGAIYISSLDLTPPQNPLYVTAGGALGLNIATLQTLLPAPAPGLVTALAGTAATNPLTVTAGALGLDIAVLSSLLPAPVIPPAPINFITSLAGGLSPLHVAAGALSFDFSGLAAVPGSGTNPPCVLTIPLTGAPTNNPLTFAGTLGVDISQLMAVPGSGTNPPCPGATVTLAGTPAVNPLTDVAGALNLDISQLNAVPGTGTNICNTGSGSGAGYTEFADGTALMWGSQSGITPGVPTIVPLPIASTITTYAVTVTVDDANAVPQQSRVLVTQKNHTDFIVLLDQGQAIDFIIAGARP